MKRRTFLKLAAGLPFFSIGAPVGGERKIRLGLIGCGGRMGHGLGYGIVNNMCGPNEEIVCIAEPDPNNWKKVRAVIKAHKPECDVSKIAAFYDYHEMLDKMGSQIDAVAIATPNHHHAPAALLAMAKGLHVYVEKPMALTVEEVRLMHAASKKYGVVTQVGNHGHSEEGMRRLVEYIRAGAIGQVREVWSFDDRVNAMRYRPPKAEPPKGMDWNAWCGPAPVCDYYVGTADHLSLHPHDWHSWIGYGNGSIGNMGTHIIDPVFWALDLGKVHPESVETKHVEWGCEGSWSVATELEWKFPARPGMDAVTLHWHDGVKPGVPYDNKHVNHIGICLKREFQNLPPVVEELEKKYGQSMGALGSIFVGEKGIIRIGPHGDSLVFGPKDIYKNRPPKLFPREKGMNHQADWLRAIRNPNRPCGCNFDYSAPLATTVLLGNAAPRAGKKKLLWDGTRFTNDEAANQYLKTTYRKGWELKA